MSVTFVNMDFNVEFLSVMPVSRLYFEVIHVHNITKSQLNIYYNVLSKG